MTSRRETGLEELADELVGHAVVVTLDRDVVVDVDPAGCPLGHLVALERQGLQGRPVEPLVELPAARSEVPHRPAVELDELLANRLIEFSEAEERPIAQRGQDPALGYQDVGFDLGFVAWLAGAGRDDHRAVVLGQLLIRAVDPGLVAAGLGDPAL